MPEVLRIRILRMFCVQPDDPELGPDLVEYVDRFGRLDEPELRRLVVNPAHSQRLTRVNVRVGGELEL